MRRDPDATPANGAKDQSQSRRDAILFAALRDAVKHGIVSSAVSATAQPSPPAGHYGSRTPTRHIPGSPPSTTTRTPTSQEKLTIKN